MRNDTMTTSSSHGLQTGGHIVTGDGERLRVDRILSSTTFSTRKYRWWERILFPMTFFFTRLGARLRLRMTDLWWRFSDFVGSRFR